MIVDVADMSDTNVGVSRWMAARACLIMLTAFQTNYTRQAVSPDHRSMIAATDGAEHILLVMLTRSATIAVMMMRHRDRIIATENSSGGGKARKVGKTRWVPGQSSASISEEALPVDLWMHETAEAAVSPRAMPTEYERNSTRAGHTVGHEQHLGV